MMKCKMNELKKLNQISYEMKNELVKVTRITYK